MSKAIIFIRHGETDQNLVEMSANSATTRIEGFKEEDYPLNATGIHQVESTATELKDAQIDVIYCSPLRRAKMTAEIINKYHDAPIIELAGLRERNSGDRVGSALHDLYDFDKNIQDEGVESLTDFVGRVYSAMDEIAKSPYEHIAIVAHGGVHHVVRAYCLKLPHAGNIRVERVPNAGIRFYEISD